jgi:hypothetical protein
MALVLGSSSVDTSAGPATVTVTARVTDDVAGVFAYKTDNRPDGSNYSQYSSSLSLRSPSGTQRASAPFDLRTDGGPLDGTYQTTLTLPQYSTLSGGGYPTTVEVVRTG